MYLSKKTSTNGKLKFEEDFDLVPEPTAKAKNKRQAKASKLLKKNIVIGKLPVKNENE